MFLFADNIPHEMPELSMSVGLIECVVKRLRAHSEGASKAWAI